MPPKKVPTQTCSCCGAESFFELCEACQRQRNDLLVEEHRRQLREKFALNPEKADRPQR